MNRPFSRFCRRCQDDLSTADWIASGTSTKLWETAARFNSENPPYDPNEPVTVADLSKVWDSPPPEAFVAAQFIQGVLAVHQAGGFLAVVHPFVSGEGGTSSVVWSTAPQPGRAPVDERPFTPFLMPDGRHIVFSSPSAVHCLDMWSLDGWSSPSDPRLGQELQAVWSCDDRRDLTLAAPPVAFDADHLGLLHWAPRKDQYVWSVFDLGTIRGSALCETSLADSTALPLTGWPCLVSAVAGRMLVFSTPKGHWVWPWWQAEEKEPSISQMSQIWNVARPADELIIYREQEDPKQNAGPKPYLFAPGIQDGKTWKLYFQFGDRNDPKLECCCLNPVVESGKANEENQGLTIPEEIRRAFPVGSHDGSMIFGSREGKKVVLFRERNYTAQRIVTLEEPALAGFVYREPLLTTAGGLHDDGRLLLCSLDCARRIVDIRLQALVSEPLLWSHWLFTTEFQDRHVVVRRRDFGPY